MGTVFIDDKNLDIRIDGNTIAFYEGTRCAGRIPLNPLDRVVIVGNHKIETSVLCRLARLDISVIFLSGKRMAFSGILHGRLHNNGLLRLKQYEKSKSDFSLKIARELVSTKIRKQAMFLAELADGVRSDGFPFKKAKDSLEAILTEVEMQKEIDSLRGLEGSAANIYFHAYALAFPESLGLKARTRRPPRDPVNAILSLSYTLLHYEMVREIEIIGLDPTIGFYHSFEYGRESLACDLVEEFRPDVDRFVYEIFKTRSLRKEDFSYDGEAVHNNGCFLKKSKRREFFQMYEMWAKENRVKWRDKVLYLSRRIMDA